MMQFPTSPAARGLTLRGNYAMASADYTVSQAWEDYSEEEHYVWYTLFSRQIGLAKAHAAPEFLTGLKILGIGAEKIPRFSEINRVLAKTTGWRIAAVPGIIPEKHFFRHLAQRCFPVSVWIREASELDRLIEPDLFHDVFGHVPLLTDPVFARFLQTYGEAGPQALAHGALHLLARLYWYSVEFGLIDASPGHGASVAGASALKACGARILSSKEETAYSLKSPVPHRIGFDLQRIMQTDYRAEDLQRTYFVIGSFSELLHALKGADFPALFERFCDASPISPATVLQEVG